MIADVTQDTGKMMCEKQEIGNSSKKIIETCNLSNTHRIAGDKLFKPPGGRDGTVVTNCRNCLRSDSPKRARTFTRCKNAGESRLYPLEGIRHARSSSSDRGSP